MTQSIRYSIHRLYNSLAQMNDARYQDVLDVLLKVHQRFDHEANPEALVHRLVNYIYFTAVTDSLHYSPDQEACIRHLADFAKRAGWNSVYRSNYGDKDQF